ncbi:hypothetical protein WMF26_05175 [Sorangium sp. So ce185]|uniref:hypothetical protein n=1 Tax=Sorangium sp. So ce185 TaxID=3133287 RepID=UPI003F6002F2
MEIEIERSHRRDAPRPQTHQGHASRLEVTKEDSMNSKFATTAWTSRSLICVGAALLAGGLSLGCVADAGIDTEEELGEAADELTGWHHYWKGSTNDETFVNMGPKADRTCVLRGVQGNLGRGGSSDILTALGSLSRAQVGSASSDNKLYGHGGSHVNSAGSIIWRNNPVVAYATCFFATLNRTWEAWHADFDGVARPWKLADLDPADRRQCFLSGLLGSDGTWNRAEDYAMVIKLTTPIPPQYPTAGWYIAGNLMRTVENSYGASVQATCVDFPEGTEFSSGWVDASEGGTKTEVIASDPGIKACALVSIFGAFNQNSWTDGVLINPPSTLDGTWTMTVSAGKTAKWACVK